MHPIKAILEDAGYRLEDAGKNWRTAAKYRNGTNPHSLAINKKTGGFIDWGSNCSGTAEDLVKLISGQKVSFEGYAPPDDEVELEKAKERVYSPDVLRAHLPQYQFFLDRGIRKEVLDEFQAGLAHSGKLYKRIVFPIFNRRGQIIGFTGRYFKKEVPEGTVKWKHESSTRTFIWPIHLNDALLSASESIILVESPGDLLALWNAGIKNVLCLFGVRLSSKLLAYILGKNPQRIILALNNDKNKKFDTGKVQAENLRKKLLKFFSENQIITANPTEKNDFGDMTVPEIQEWAKFYEIHY